MCGIVGVFSRRRPISAGLIQRATESLYHRGPDGQRHWIGFGGRVALGHARLSIIDLTRGDQPIASEDGRTRIVVNGEFYGYECHSTGDWNRQAIVSVLGRTARSLCTCMRTLARNACTVCAVNSPLCFGMRRTGLCLRPVIGLASSRCSMPSTMKRFIWLLK